MGKIKVGISACLLGQPVRYDGRHKKSAFCVDVLSKWFDFHPICPEVEIGLGTPRAPIHLVKENNQIRVKNTVDHSQDHTVALQQLADHYAHKINTLCGYIFMQKSPSCGLEEVKVHDADGTPLPETHTGVFVAQIKLQHPLLPTIEARALQDKGLREHFITRVLAQHDWQHKVMAAPHPKNLLAFHQRHELLFKNHLKRDFKKLSEIAANTHAENFTKLSQQYFELFTGCLNEVTDVGSHLQLCLEDSSAEFLR